MDAVRQTVKIAAALAALLVLALLLVPERPTLFGGVSSPGAIGEEGELAEGSANEVATRSEETTLVETAAETPESPSGDPAPSREPTLPEAQTPSAGALHLQRLRAGDGQAPAAAPAPPAPAAPPPADPPSSSVSPPTAPADAEPQPSAEPSPNPAVPPASTGPIRFQLVAGARPADSATLVAGGLRVRLAGAVGVGADARCRDGSACGQEAVEALETHLGGEALLCAVPEGATSAEAPCLLGEEDVAEWLVANGWATAGPASRYGQAEAQAREARLGIWAAGGL